MTDGFACLSEVGLPFAIIQFTWMPGTSPGMTSLTSDNSQKGPAMPQGKIRHFGVLIPSTNTTVETEFTRLLPPEWQPHYARVKSASIDGSPFSPPLDADVEYQSKLLGTAKVEIVMLIQTSASLFSEDYDDKAMRLMQGAGAPGFTSAMAIGEALNALGTKRIALVSPYSETVIASARRYYEGRYGLSVVALEGFAATEFVHDRQSRAGNGARRLRPHRPSRDRGVCRARRQFPDNGIDRSVGRGIRQAGRHDQPGRAMGHVKAARQHGPHAGARAAAGVTPLESAPRLPGRRGGPFHSGYAPRGKI